MLMKILSGCYSENGGSFEAILEIHKKVTENLFNGRNYQTTFYT